jgi:antitoxin HicB
MPGKKKPLRFNVIFRAEPEGGFTAMVPALPGCVTHGRTLAEAKEMVKDAIAGYVKSLRKHGDIIPTDEETFVASLDLAYAETARR